MRACCLDGISATNVDTSPLSALVFLLLAARCRRLCTRAMDLSIFGKFPLDQYTYAQLASLVRAGATTFDGDVAKLKLVFFS